MSRNGLKVLVTGASGSLGFTIAGGLEPTCSVYAGWNQFEPQLKNAEMVQINLQEPGHVKKIIEDLKPGLVVHCAAMTDPEICKKDPDLTRRINTEATREIAEATRDIHGKLIYLSTDLIFDGKKTMYGEEDEPNPLNEYANSKYLGEIAIRDSVENFLILRISVVYGFGYGRKGTFSDWLISNLNKGNEVRLFDDQYRTSFYLPDGARVMKDLIPTNCTGVFHVGGAERLSRYQFGVTLAKRLGLPEDLIIQTKMADCTDFAKRPGDCSLRTTKLNKAIGFSPTPLEVAFSEMAEKMEPTQSSKP